MSSSTFFAALAGANARSSNRNAAVAAEWRDYALELEAKLKQSAAAIEQLQNSLKTARVDDDRRIAVIERLSDELDAARQQNKGSQAEISTLNQELSAAQQQSKENKAQLSTLNHDLIEDRKQIESDKTARWQHDLDAKERLAAVYANHAVCAQLIVELTGKTVSEAMGGEHEYAAALAEELQRFRSALGLYE